jgi:hypothetical protein
MRVSARGGEPLAHHRSMHGRSPNDHSGSVYSGSVNWRTRRSAGSIRSTVIWPDQIAPLNARRSTSFPRRTSTMTKSSPSTRSRMSASPARARRRTRRRLIVAHRSPRPPIRWRALPRACRQRAGMRRWPSRPRADPRRSGRTRPACDSPARRPPPARGAGIRSHLGHHRGTGGRPPPRLPTIWRTNGWTRAAPAAPPRKVSGLRATSGRRFRSAAGLNLAFRPGSASRRRPAHGRVRRRTRRSRH